MIKAGIFDVGGVLIETRLEPMYADIKNTLGISNQLFEIHYRPLVNELSLGIISEAEFWHRLIERTESEGVLPQESLFKRSYYQNNFIINAELMMFVDNLKSSGLKTAILSNTIEPHAELMREYELTKNFDVQILSNEVHMKKPDLEIYKTTLNKLEVKPEEAFFVDDLLENVEAANKLGIQGILFHDAAQCISKIKMLGIGK